MTEALPISEDDLQAYVDHALDAERHEQVRAYLERHPETAERIATYQAQRAALREALAPIAEEPIPPELNLRAMISERRTRAAYRRSAVAAALVLCIGGAVGWSANDLFTPPAGGVRALAREAADNYQVYASDVRRPVEIGATQQADLVRWVSGRLRTPVEVPDLRAAGYNFLGGRLVTTPNGPAAMFVYEGADSSRLAVLVRPMRVDKTAAMSEQDHGALGGVTWADDGIGYSVVGPNRSAELHPLAVEVRRQIEAPAPGFS